MRKINRMMKAIVRTITMMRRKKEKLMRKQVCRSRAMAHRTMAYSNEKIKVKGTSSKTMVMNDYG